MSDSLRLYRTFELSMKGCIESILNRGKNKFTLKNRSNLTVLKPTKTRHRYIMRSIPPTMRTIRNRSNPLNNNIVSISQLCNNSRPSLIYRSYNTEFTLSTHSKRRRYEEE